MCLNKIDENIWNLEGDEVKMLMIPFQTRMTVIRLPENKLWLHSPVALNEKRISLVGELGDVSYIVAPNLFHHLFIENWLKRFPLAKLWGVEGLAQVRLKIPINYQ